MTQRQSFSFILKDTNYTKVNPTGFPLLVCAGVFDFILPALLNELMLNSLFYFLIRDISSYLISFDAEPDSFTFWSKLLADLGLLFCTYWNLCTEFWPIRKKHAEKSTSGYLVQLADISPSYSIIRFI